MGNVATVAKYLSRLSLMKYFPSDPDARTALVEMVCGMIESEEQADWLAKRMLQIYREWPGPHEMRACFCWRHKPADGINAYSQVYPDCMPVDPTAPKRIDAPEILTLPSGQVTADVHYDKLVRKSAEVLGLPSGRFANGRRIPDNQAAGLLREILTAPQDRPLIAAPKPPEPPTPQVITQSDIDRAVTESRAKKAAQDIHA